MRETIVKAIDFLNCKKRDKLFNTVDNSRYSTDSNLNVLFEQLYDLRSKKSYSPLSDDRCQVDSISNFETWNFEPLGIEINDVNFVSMVYHVFKKIFLVFNVKEVDLENMYSFICEVAQIYHDALNPYHNIRHAIHVFHTMHLIVMNHLIYLPNMNNSPHLIIAAYIAALCHDIDHCGCTNRYLIATNHVKAIKSNGSSPQEMHHAFVTVDLLRKHTVFRNTKDFKQIRMMIVRFILATNIAEHESFMNNIQKSRKSQIIMLALKCADLSHTFAPYEKHVQWIKKLQAEFFIQGDKELFHKLQITTMFDRSKPDTLFNTQADFFRILVLPMFNKLYEVCPSIKLAINESLLINYSTWNAHNKNI